METRVDVFYLNINSGGLDGPGDVVPEHNEEQGEGLRVGGADPVEDGDHIAETLRENDDVS